MPSRDHTPELEATLDGVGRPETPPDEVSASVAEAAHQEATGSEGMKDATLGAAEAAPDTTAQNSGEWQAVFSAEANAWYFWNSATNETTWQNPRENPSSSDAVPPEASTSHEPELSSSDPATSTGLPPIDPDLAWLDPSASRGNSTGAQAARFHARTGRFQVDPKFTPDRISDYQRGHRQQEAYYDVKGWEQQLDGKGLKRTGDAVEEEGARKRPSSKQVEKFKQQKQEKKKKKLTSWLAN